MIENYRAEGLGISVISCWQIAKLVEKQRLGLTMPVEDWLTLALAYPDVVLIDLTIPIIVQSTKLINFHKDPADQIIVSTAKVYNCPLFTLDRKILEYRDVQTLN